MQLDCPKCGETLAINLKESLKPYTMTMTIKPEKGRMVAAKTVGGVIANFAELLANIGDDVGHDTIVHVHDLRVDDDMSVHVTVNCTPMRKDAPSDSKAGA